MMIAPKAHTASIGRLATNATHWKEKKNPQKILDSAGIPTQGLLIFSHMLIGFCAEQWKKQHNLEVLAESNCFFQMEK